MLAMACEGMSQCRAISSGSCSAAHRDTSVTAGSRHGSQGVSEGLFSGFMGPSILVSRKCGDAGLLVPSKIKWGTARSAVCLYEGNIM